jgi:tetratricopeptide (TPR) repeat protein
MKNKFGIKRAPITLSLALSAVACVSLVAAQEIVPVSDLTGGTSVFVFRGKSKSVSKKFVTQAKSRRTKSQRSASTRRVTSQYTKLAKNAPRRTRTKAVDPNNLPPQIATMPKEEASKLFSGVGEYYMDRDDYDRAIDFFRESLTLDSTNAISKSGLSEALALKGNALLADDAQDVARKFFEEAISYNNRNAPAYYGLAEVLSEEGDEDGATVNYERSLEFDKELTEIYVPLGILYYQKGNVAKADELLGKAIGINAQDAMSQHFIGLVRLQQGRDQEAVDAFARAKSLDAKNAESFYYSGEALTRLNRISDAIADFRKAIELRENYFEAWYGLGSAYFEMENYQEAVTAFERAKKLKNNNAEVVANLGDAYRQLATTTPNDNRNNYQAESNYNLAVTFFERTPGFEQNQALKDLTADIYGKIAYMIGKQCEINAPRGLACKWDVAVRALERSSQLSESNVDYANLGWAYYNAGRADIKAARAAEGRTKLEKARDNLKKAVDTNPQYVVGPLMNLGMVYTDLGDYKGAIGALKRVVDKEPKWVFALNELGLAYYNDNNFKAAISQFKKAVDRDGKFAQAYYNLGVAEFKNGNIGEAQKAHSKLKSLGRNDLAVRLQVATNGAVRG